MSEVPVEFASTHRVRFREVDPYGHMNMSHYFGHLVDHRFHGMRTRLNLGYEKLESLGFAFHTRKIEFEFIQSLGPDEEFQIKSSVSQAQKATLWVEFRFLKMNGNLAAKGVMKIGCIDKASGKPVPWPDSFMDSFYCNESENQTGEVKYEQ